jgi:hypothetical protein
VRHRALGERLQSLADHPVEALAMGMAGRQVVLEFFQLKQVVQRCPDAYASL